MIVGLVGLATLLVAGSLIVTGFRDLTGISTYDTSFETFPVTLPQRAGTLTGGQASKMEAFGVPHPNVTSAKLRLTWSETLSGQHELTLVLKNPLNEVVGQQTGTGGIAGLLIAKQLRPVPRGERFSEVSERIADEFDERYASFPEDRGMWTVQILSKGPGGPTDTGLSYTVSFDYVWWRGTWTEVPQELSK